MGSCSITIKPSMERSGKAGLAPVIAGATAGVITVYAVMPFDVIKTSMQALGASTGGTMGAFRSILQRSGWRGFWKGTTPRLARLSVSFPSRKTARGTNDRVVIQSQVICHIPM
jgi:solute carrier family 25 citrate transporter 1